MLADRAPASRPRAPIAAIRSAEKSVLVDVGVLHDAATTAWARRSYRDALVPRRGRASSSTDHGCGPSTSVMRWRVNVVAPADVAEVRERQRVQEPVVAGGEVADVAGDGGHRVVRVDRALGRAGGAAGPDDAHRIARTRSPAAAAGGSAAKASFSSSTGRTRPGSTPSGTVAPSPTTVTAGSVRATMLACSAGPRRRLIGGGDRAGPGRAEVAGRELDRRRGSSGTTTSPGLHAAVEERGGESVGGAVEPAVSRRACRRGRRPRDPGSSGRGRTQEVGQQRHRHRSARYRGCGVARGQDR